MFNCFVLFGKECVLLGGGANARADPPKWRSHNSEADSAEEGNHTKKRSPHHFFQVPVGGAEEIKTPECDENTS